MIFQAAALLLVIGSVYFYKKFKNKKLVSQQNNVIKDVCEHLKQILSAKCTSSIETAFRSSLHKVFNKFTLSNNQEEQTSLNLVLKVQEESEARRELNTLKERKFPQFLCLLCRSPFQSQPNNSEENEKEQYFSYELIGKIVVTKQQYSYIQINNKNNNDQTPQVFAKIFSLQMQQPTKEVLAESQLNQAEDEKQISFNEKSHKIEKKTKKEQLILFENDDSLSKLSAYKNNGCENIKDQSTNRSQKQQPNSIELLQNVNKESKEREQNNEQEDNSTTYGSSRTQDFKSLELAPITDDRQTQWRNGLQNNGNSCYFNSAIQLMMHCLDMVEFKKEYKSPTLTKLLKLKSSNTKDEVNENLKEIFDSLSFMNKQQSSRTGNDPVRIISSIACYEQEGKDEPLELDTSKVKFATDEYTFWAEDNTELSFLFQSVAYEALWCEDCQKCAVMQNEQRTYFNIPAYKSNETIQGAIQKSSEFKPTVQQCEKNNSHSIKQINGFIKLPQFFYASLDLKLMNKIEINPELKLKDHLRDVIVTYRLIGFICNPKFHYTYVRKENDNKFIHFNDDYISEYESHNHEAYPVKGLLYSCTEECDPTIFKHLNFK